MTQPRDPRPSEPQDPHPSEPHDGPPPEPQESRPAFEPPDPSLGGPASPGGPPLGGPGFGPPPQPGPYPRSYGGPAGAPPYGPPPYAPPSQPPPYGRPYGGPPHQPGPPYPGPPVPHGYGPPPQGFSAVDDKTWALLAYIGQFAIGWIAPLVVYLTQKDRSPYLRFHGAQALNFALTSLIIMLSGLMVSLVTLGIGAIVAVPVMLVYAITHFIYLIIAAVRANKGELYAIPKWLCWPMVR